MLISSSAAADRPSVFRTTACGEEHVGPGSPIVIAAWHRNALASLDQHIAARRVLEWWMFLASYRWGHASLAGASS